MQNDINKKITALKKELEQVSIEDSSTKDHINILIQEIEALNIDSPTNNNPVIDKIRNSIEEFETEHPRATAILNDIMVTLSNIGI